ncbi:ETEC_3214 domain-containing protein [Mycetocola miduiensis]|nr:ETEC_3214 domain-containing protein [Mycetocola miduiensis]
MRRITKSVLAIAGLISAILVIFAAGTYLRATWTNYEDYEMLEPLAAGLSGDRLTQILGEPSTTHEGSVQRGADLTEIVSYRLYIQEKFVVSALVDDSEEVVMLSVLSCDGGFHPSFTTPGFTTASLNSDSLSSINNTQPDAVTISYPGEGSGGGPVIYAEIIGPQADHSTRFHAYAWGVNGVCDPANRLTDSSGSFLQPYTGSVTDAPNQMADFRSSTAPNFYAETSSGYPLIDSNVFSISPSRDDLPAWFLEEQGVGECEPETPGCLDGSG